MKEEKVQKNKKLIALGTTLVVAGIIVGYIPIMSDKIQLLRENDDVERFLTKQKSSISEMVDNKISENVITNDNLSENTIVDNNNENENNNNVSYVDSKEFSMVLEIPKIKLQKGIYHKESKYNSVKYNIEILEPSDMPDVEKGNLILASHRGSSSVSYFNGLSKLAKGDLVSVYYGDVKYTYKISDVYYIKKTGAASIIRDENETVLTMITCVKNNKNKQVVYISNLISKENY